MFTSGSQCEGHVCVLHREPKYPRHLFPLTASCLFCIVIGPHCIDILEHAVQYHCMYQFVECCSDLYHVITDCIVLQAGVFNLPNCRVLGNGEGPVSIVQHHS